MQDTYWIDKRNKEDIIRELFDRAAGYQPDWKASASNPDIAAVLLLLYAGQMEDNIKRYNSFIERCNVELVNMLDIRQRQAKAAHMMVIMKPVAGQNGGYIDKGTAIVVNTPDEDNPRIIFETTGRRYITDAIIESIVISDKVKILEHCIYGKNDAWKEINFNKKLYDGEEYSRVVLYHRNMFNTPSSSIRFETEANIDFVDALRRGEYEISYLSKDGIERKVQIYNTDGNSFSIDIEDPGEVEFVDDEEQKSRLYITRRKNTDKDIYINRLLMSSTGRAKKCEYIYSAGVNRDRTDFRLFGDTLDLYTEAYICMDEYFRQSGSLISIIFEYTENINMVGIMPKEEEDLRIIKRRSRDEHKQVIADVYAGRVLFEYYTQKGWKRLELIDEEGAQELFNGQHLGINKLSFISPYDWEAADIQGYSGRCIRIQLMSAEFCYYQPARHHLPVIRNLSVEYSYRNYPQCPEGYSIMDKDGEREYKWGRRENLFFKAHRIDEDALNIGFNKKIEGGPVSLFFRIAENRYMKPLAVRYEYHTNEGFKSLTVEDHTEGGRHSGTIEFVPPYDWTETSIDGRRAYYIRIVDEYGEIRKDKSNKPVIEMIYINGIETVNVHWLDEQEFYIENISDSMQFNLGIKNLYDAEVWVNEKEHYSEKQMKLLESAFRTDYRLLYDSRGTVKAFLVRWHETDSFERSEEKRVYMLDRGSGQLLFGDGVKVNIPDVTDDLAFIVRPGICNGSIGNVDSGSAESLLGNSVFVSEIDNPMPSYGGSDTENMERAAKRGKQLLCSFGRLITSKDFEREVSSFSEDIFDVKCLSDRKGRLDIVVLRKSQNGGAAGFHELKNALMEHLTSKCEMTLGRKDICIEEPLFVEISVSVWIRIKGDTDRFQVEETIQDILSEYLDPISGNGGKGWKIGELPTKISFLMKIGYLEDKADIESCAVNVKYRDEAGIHDGDVEKFMDNPYVAVRNGVHKVMVIK